MPRGEGRARGAAGELLGAGEELAAQLLDYHDRERKPVWWAFFDRIELTPAGARRGRRVDRAARSRVGEPEKVDRSLAYTLTFPAQEHKIGEGAEHVRPGDEQATRGDRRARPRGAAARAQARPELRGGAVARGARSPGGRTTRPDQEGALERLGRSLLAGDGRYPALESVLRREPFDRPMQTSELDELKALVLSLDGRHLVIQGPPGLGEDVDVGTADRASARARQACRRRLDEPQGDPQSAGRGRGGCRASRDLVRAG